MGNVQPDPHADRDDGVAPATSDALRVLAPMALAYLALDRDGYESLKDQVRTAARRDPIDTLMWTVLGGGLAFYVIEHEKNPAVETLWDAILYVATSLSVGYDNLFPKTELGNALASAVHTFGPSMAAAAFDPPGGEAAKADELLAVNRAILNRLDEIALLLHKS